MKIPNFKTFWKFHSKTIPFFHHWLDYSGRFIYASSSGFNPKVKPFINLVPTWYFGLGVTNHIRFLDTIREHFHPIYFLCSRNLLLSSPLLSISGDISPLFLFSCLLLMMVSTNSGIFSKEQDCLVFTINIISLISILSLTLLYNWHLGGTVEAEMITTIGFATWWKDTR